MSVELGVIIPVSHRMDDLGAILDLVRGGLEATGRTFEILNTNQLDEGCDASPAVAGDQLFLRAKNHLYCIGEK